MSNSLLSILPEYSVGDKTYTISGISSTDNDELRQWAIKRVQQRFREILGDELTFEEKLKMATSLTTLAPDAIIDEAFSAAGMAKYVHKSLSKKHPELTLEEVEGWDMGDINAIHSIATAITYPQADENKAKEAEKKGSSSRSKRKSTTKTI